MISPAIEAEIAIQLNKLSPEQQQQVLEFARTLAQTAPSGTPGNQLLRFAGTIAQPDLQLIAKAVEEGCEQVITDEW